MPSRRRQTSATAPALASVRAKAGCAPLARSRNRRPAPEASRRQRPCAASGSGRAREGTRQAVSPAMPRASRLVARTRTWGHARSTPSTRRAQASSRCSQLSSTSSGPPGARCARGAGAAPRASSRTARPRRQGGGRAPGRGRPGGQVDEPHPVRVPLQGVRRRLEGQAGLARPPGAGEGQQAVGAQQGRHLPQLPLPPHEAGDLQGQVVGERVQGAQGREVAGEPRGGQLEHPLRGPGPSAGTPPGRAGPRAPAARPAPGPPWARRAPPAPRGPWP